MAVRLFFGLISLSVAAPVFPQQPAPAQPAVAASASQDSIPDAPTPQIELAAAVDPQSAQTQTPQQPASGATPAQNDATQSSSSSQNSSGQPGTQKTQRQKAEEQVKEEEHQRMAGIVPAFNVSYHSDAVSLTPAEKFNLEFHSATDPYTFAISMVVAGLGEAEDSNSGFGWGPEGYTKRAAAAYADNVIGNTLGNAVLPSILHQDPRYFRLGHGSLHHRFFYAVATSFICKHDNTGKWEPNYSNVLGNIVAGEISNLYYPDSGSNIGRTIGNGLTVTFEGTFGATLQEFWPDISRKFFHKDPTHGLDAQAREKDAAEKRKRQEENQTHPQ
ncbi:MAG: hypothetical protein ACLQG3_01090 [Terracidiphilus sp.]